MARKKKNRGGSKPVVQQTPSPVDDVPVTEFEQRNPRTYLTPELADKVEELTRKGLHKYRIAAALDIGRKTFSNWMKLGARHPDEYPDCAALLARIKRAEAWKVEKNIGNIQTAADTGQWQASAWILERQHPEEFASDRRIIALLEKKVTELEKLLAAKDDDVGS